jgi:transcriptional regulator with XRE-family HTH domain
MVAARALLHDLGEVDRAYVSGLELGHRNPTVVTLWHVAEASSNKLRRAGVRGIYTIGALPRGGVFF